MTSENEQGDPKRKSTLSLEQQASIEALLKDMFLPTGLGTKDSACSIAAINLALTGELTDEVPECMSEVIGKWVIGVQDDMPASIRNSLEWKGLLPLAAGTGRELEKERSKLVLKWVWESVLPSLQGLASSMGFGLEWEIMLLEKNEASAKAAAGAARAAGAAGAAEAAGAAGAAEAAEATGAAEAAEAIGAAEATGAAEAAEAAGAAEATGAAAWAAWAAARAAGAAAGAAEASWTKGGASAEAAAWQTFNPCALLKQLTELSK